MEPNPDRSRRPERRADAAPRRGADAQRDHPGQGGNQVIVDATRGAAPVERFQRTEPVRAVRRRRPWRWPCSSSRAPSPARVRPRSREVAADAVDSAASPDPPRGGSISAPPGRRVAGRAPAANRATRPLRAGAATGGSALGPRPRRTPTPALPEAAPEELAHHRSSRRPRHERRRVGATAAPSGSRGARRVTRCGGDGPPTPRPGRARLQVELLSATGRRGAAWGADRGGSRPGAGTRAVPRGHHDRLTPETGAGAGRSPREGRP
jgi:hypothetical protein